MVTLAEKYRLKAMQCERLACEATDAATKFAWSDIAIEWHALASRTGQAQSDVQKQTIEGR